MLETEKNRMARGWLTKKTGTTKEGCYCDEIGVSYIPSPPSAELMNACCKDVLEDWGELPEVYF